MTKEEMAVSLKHNGHNCAQAVVLTFKEELGLPEETLNALTSGFGGGMGCMESTCGALIGATIVVGLKNNSGAPTVMASRDMLAKFREMSGATICHDLKGRDTGKVLCECDDCIRHAVTITQEKLASMN